MTDEPTTKEPQSSPSPKGSSEQGDPGQSAVGQRPLTQPGTAERPPGQGGIGHSPPSQGATATTLTSLSTLLARRGLGAMQAAFAPGTEAFRTEIAQRILASTPVVQAYVKSRMEKLDSTLEEQVREAIQWEQDMNLARGTRFIADWIASGKAPSKRDLDVISTMGRRAATSKATFGRILRATLASRDAISAVVADSCHAIGAPQEVMVGLLTGVHVAHDRILIHSAKEFDIEASAIAEALVSERAQLEQLAKQDALTGVSNRRGFYDYLESVLAQRRRRRDGQLAIFFVDLDHFKELNDSYGHQIGDEVLRVVAERLSETARPSDQVARLGGDEFVLVMNGLPESNLILSEVASRILDSLRAPIVALGKTLQMTASVGVAVAPERISNADQLVNSADRAMYAAKHSGRNTFRVAS